MIKSPLNVPALQARKNKTCSRQSAWLRIKYVPVSTFQTAREEKKNKVENQPGLLSEGMKGNREVREGRQKLETSQREQRTKSREEMLGVPARRQLPNHSV